MSPGERHDYVMGYAFDRGNKRRSYIKGEIAHLHTIGYSYNNTFATDSAAQIANHVPHSKKMESDTSNRLFSFFLSKTTPEELLPPDYTITNDSGVSVTINILGNPDFEDADGDTIRIADGSLVNYRGCGIGGNNHKCLSVSNRNQTITFTPRHNFYGRAQFGFNLRDSLQEGGFVLYTIEVKKGNNVSTPADSNLALNGDFEEGTEVKTTDSSNYLIRNSLWLRGQMNHLYSDCHPFDFSFAWAGTAIRNSLKTCTLPLGTAAYWGGENTTFPFTFDFTPPWIATYLAPEAVASVGNRYQPISDTLNVYLTDTMRRCNQYTLEFDAVHLQKWISPTIPYPKYDEVGVGFWSDTMFYAGMPRRSYRPAFVYRTNKIVYGSWTHFSVPFSYCSDTTANILSISLKGLMGTVPGFQAIDNITLKRSTEPISFTIIDSASGPCRRRLFPDLIETGCSTNTYAWRKLGDTAVISTSASLEINTATVNSYVLTIQGSCGDSSSDTFSTYTPCPCSIGAVFGSAKDSVLPATLATGLSGGEYHLSGNLDITASLSFSNVNVLIEPGSRIRVAPGAKLTLDNAHLFVCPDTNLLWKGISLQSGTNSGRISVLGNSLIEDADTAIWAGSPATTTGDLIVETDDAIFNRNRYGIVINNYTATSPVHYPFSIGRTLFTSRSFDTVSGYPASWPSGNLLRKHVYSTDAVVPFVISRDYPAALLKDGYWAMSGMSIANVGTFVSGIYPEIAIGVRTDTSYRNLFDNTGDGITASNTNLRVNNSIFVNLLEVPAGARTIGLKYPLGAGVNKTNGYNRRGAICYATGPNGDLINEFYDCSFGVRSRDYSIDSIWRNNFYTCATYADNRAKGMDIGLSRFDSIRIEGNFLYNVPVGILVNNNASAAGYGSGRIVIYDNRIYAQWPSPVTSSSSRFVFQGIDLKGSVTSAGIPAGSLIVQKNLLTDVWNGISISNFLKQYIFVYQNSVQMALQDTSSAQYGMALSNTFGASVYGNDVTGTSGLSANDLKRAYYATANKTLGIQCNHASQTGRGFDFVGTQPRTFWRGNVMENHLRGFALGGIIDLQGGTVQRHLNEWNGTWGGLSAHTYTYDRINPVFSGIFADTLHYPAEFPTSNASDAYTVSYATPTSIVNTDTAIDHPCDPAPPTYTPETAIYLPGVVKIMKGTIDFGHHNAAQNWIAQMGLWRLLHYDDSFAYYNNHCATFAMMADTTRFGYLTDIEDALAEGDTNTAESLLHTVPRAYGNLFVDSSLMLADSSAANYIVDNYTRYYRQYLAYLKGQTPDSVLLANLSYLCPVAHGDVVFQARALYQQLFGLSIVFPDDDLCGYTTEEGLMRKGQPSAEMNGAPNGQYSLYPNPNNGNFTVQRRGIMDATVRVRVYNALGMLVYDRQTTFINGSLSVALNPSAPGVYGVCIIEGNKTECLHFVKQ